MSPFYIKNISSYIKDILFLLGNDKRKLPTLLLLFLAISLIEVIGIGVIAPYISLVLELEFSGATTFEDALLSVTNIFPDINPLLLIGLGLVFLFLVKGLFAILIHWVIVRFSLHQAVRLRTWLMAKYQEMPYEQFMQGNSANYIQATQLYTQQFTSTLQGLLQIVSEGLVVFAILIFLSVTNAAALTLLIALLGISAICYDQLFKGKLQKAGAEANQQNIEAIRGVTEGIEGLKEIRILRREKFFFDIVREGTERWAKSSTHAQVISSAPKHIFQLAAILFVVIVINGSDFVGIDQTSLVPVLSMFAVATMRLLPSVTLVTSTLTRLRFQRYAISMLEHDLHDHNDQLQTHFSDRTSEGVETPAVEPFQTLSVKRVKFRYPNSNDWAIDDVSLEIKAGESIGFIGSSGSGKTTLVDIMLGLLQPQVGEIEFNGRQLSTALNDWHSQAAYLPQELFMIDNSLRLNITLGKITSEQEPDDKNLSKVIAQAQLTELVSNLPDGVDTKSGERGVGLSGGQRQRVALARALYHSRTVLILDEATSALDYATEAEIVDEITRFKGKKTLIVIAHRLSTLKGCDKIYRIENGRLVEHSTPAQGLKN
jgi:ATP-binding cassette subfamily C protein